jgi:hypothetical protein
MKISSQVELKLLIAIGTRLLLLILASLSAHHIALATIHAATTIASAHSTVSTSILVHH